jgi:hypothetical protein
MLSNTDSHSEHRNDTTTAISAKMINVVYILIHSSWLAKAAR